MTTITWEAGGKESWQRFSNGIAFTVNFLPGGPRVTKLRTPGRPPVGTITAGDVTLTIRPGQSLIIPDRTDPHTWQVR